MLTAKDLRSAQHPGGPDAVGAVGALSRTPDLIGRHISSRVRAGELLTDSRLIPRSAAEGLPSDTVAAHVLHADERSLDLIAAGQRVTLFAATGGRALARDVLVLGVDTPENPTLTGSLPGTGTTPRGLVVALSPTALDQVFAGQRPDGGAPRILTVATQ